MHGPARIWAVLPAAGVGRRMGADLPKQYLPLLGQPIVRWTLDALLGHSSVHGGVIALSPHDPHWDALEYRHAKPLHRVAGGAERSDSVFAALDYLLAQGCGGADWVLVHDAVRPCVTPAELDRLIAVAPARPDGGLLAVPVRDTLKRQDAGGRVRDTASRDGLWHALTPQLFPLVELHQALTLVIERGTPVTDESQAMENAGYQPLLVEGQATNLKVTRQADLALAEAILRSLQAREQAPCA
jgi:2-C-methyl-D-erythritol 4-phosphate cytidylyltransferase